MSVAPISDSTWQHPLIRPLSRRRLMLSSLTGAGMIALAKPLANHVAAQEGTPADAGNGATPAVITPGATGDEDAVALLTSASETMANLKTFHFDIETLQGGDTSVGVNVQKIEGDVRRPLDFQATITAKVPFGTITVRAVGINGVFSIQNPLENNGSWMTLDGGNEFFSLVNPDVILLLAVRALQDAKIDGTEKIDGVETTLVTGQIDFQQIAKAYGNDSERAGVASQLAASPLDVLVWIDGDTRIHAIELDGALLAIDSDSSSRMITFSAYDEPVEIAPPA